MSRYQQQDDPFMQELEEEFDRFQRQQYDPAPARPPRRQEQRKAPAPAKKVSYSTGGSNKRKTVILAVAALIMFAWITGMMMFDKQYQAEHAADTNAVQMQTFEGLFMDMDNNGQIDTLLIDINGDGLIDFRMSGDMVQVNQAAEQPENPPPPAQ